MSGVFFALRTWQMKNRGRGKNILGSGDSFETLESPLQPISASQACSGALWEVSVAHCCVSGRERESENIRKWQQMKLAGCGVLFPPARSNEQALRTDGGNWSLEGPEPSPSPSPLSGVFATYLWTYMEEDCLPALAYSHHRLSCCWYELFCSVLWDLHSPSCWFILRLSPLLIYHGAKLFK